MEKKMIVYGGGGRRQLHRVMLEMRFTYGGV